MCAHCTLRTQTHLSESHPEIHRVESGLFSLSLFIKKKDSHCVECSPMPVCEGVYVSQSYKMRILFTDLQVNIHRRYVHELTHEQLH